jgi:hypothetical protein
MLDTREWSRLDGIFTGDAVWEKPAMTPLVGLPRIREYFQEIDRERERHGGRAAYLHRHLFTTVVIEPLDEVHAKGCAYAIVYMCRGFDGNLPGLISPPELIVDYREEFVKTADGWRISRHFAEQIFRAAAYSQPLSAEATAHLQATTDRDRPRA